MKRLYFVFLAYEGSMHYYYLYIIINLFYYVLKMFLFCYCPVSLHSD